MSLRSHFDLVIFDWAGTMVDFGCQAPIKALLQAFQSEGITLEEAGARRDMGKAKVDHVRALLSQSAVAAQWRARFGRAAQAADVDRLMTRLTPLMREQAALASTLIPGALQTFEQLRAAGIRVASSTGYTRDMMQTVLKRAAEQGYSPEHLVCAGETPAGRPSPLMIYKACAELGVWPLTRVVKVDDAEAGIAEGKAAGAFTVGVTSGNELGLAYDTFQALPAIERARRTELARRSLLAAGADLVVDSVAGLFPALLAVADQRVA